MNLQSVAKNIYFGAVEDSPTILEDICPQGQSQMALHERASALTRKHFGDYVFVRGVVEVSNVCRENCCYCGMRRDNAALDRFRANLDELADLLVNRRPASITEVNIQGGEDPLAAEELVLPLIRIIRNETPLGIIVSMGTLDERMYKELHDAGASIYLLKFETADNELYEQMRAPGKLEERLQHIRHLATAGWSVSSGFISGLPGQSLGGLRDNLQLAARLPLVGCSVSPFIAGLQTPLANASAGNINWALNCISTMRLMKTKWIIPAVSALNLVGNEGYRAGLRAGANLVTMNLTPPEIRRNYVIYSKNRYVMTEDRILSAISAEGLKPSPLGWTKWLKSSSLATRY